MSNYKNHLVDPTYFYDCIEEFAFDYDAFVRQGKEIDEYGKEKITFKPYKIRGSLQTQGNKIRQSKSGNTNNVIYDFYCKSLYRIDIGDVIKYKNNWLRVDSVHEYDEWGVRKCSLTMFKLTTYKDFYEYIKYLHGEITV